MPNLYRGIDIAADKGETGFVELVEAEDGRLQARCVEVDLTGREGLEALVRVGEGGRRRVRHLRIGLNPWRRSFAGTHFHLDRVIPAIVNQRDEIVG